MKAALENFSKMEAQHKIVILGDMFELGETSLEEHHQIAAQAISDRTNQCIFVGPLFSQSNAAKAQHFFQNITDCINYLKKLSIKDCTLLIKGSRGMKMEQLLPFFQTENT
jgi:UDP-N-acetylmuramoyl-tripeptide--D-alanyl-D-alanine ligase